MQCRKQYMVSLRSSRGGLLLIFARHKNLGRLYSLCGSTRCLVDGVIPLGMLRSAWSSG